MIVRGYGGPTKEHDSSHKRMGGHAILDFGEHMSGNESCGAGFPGQANGNGNGPPSSQPVRRRDSCLKRQRNPRYLKTDVRNDRGGIDFTRKAVTGLTGYVKEL
jgi:hypothetical protein